jgi:hypothetical protein
LTRLPFRSSSNNDNYKRTPSANEVGRRSRCRVVSAMAARRPASVVGLAPQAKVKAAKACNDHIQQISQHVVGEVFLEASAATVNNAKYFTNLRDSIETILSHPFFETVLAEMPLGIGNSGHKNAFNQTDYDTAMANVGLFEASCNFWWQGFKPTQAGLSSIWVGLCVSA